jgi:hypothetical protein
LKKILPARRYENKDRGTAKDLRLILAFESNCVDEAFLANKSAGFFSV